MTPKGRMWLAEKQESSSSGLCVEDGLDHINLSCHYNYHIELSSLQVKVFAG